jgi:hypothetical protein
MKEVKIDSKIIIKNLKTRELFEKTIKYEKVEWIPYKGTGAYGDLDYKARTNPEKIENNIITNVTPLAKAIIGKRVGDMVRVNGMDFEIISID